MAGLVVAAAEGVARAVLDSAALVAQAAASTTFSRSRLTPAFKVELKATDKQKTAIKALSDKLQDKSRAVMAEYGLGGPGGPFGFGGGGGGAGGGGAGAGGAGGGGGGRGNRGGGGQGGNGGGAGGGGGGFGGGGQGGNGADFGGGQGGNGGGFGGGQGGNGGGLAVGKVAMAAVVVETAEMAAAEAIVATSIRKSSPRWPRCGKPCRSFGSRPSRV